MATKMWEILVPTVRNNGKPYRTKHHRAWDEQVRRITGGLTILTPAKGQWVNPQDGQLFHDRMIPVRIVADDVQIREIIRRTFIHYSDQLAVLCYKISDEVLLVERPANLLITEK